MLLFLYTLSQETVAPRWFNWAKENGRHVIANARCGANYSDFDVSAYKLRSQFLLILFKKNPEYTDTTHLSTYSHSIRKALTTA